MELLYKGILIGIAIGIVGVLFVLPVLQQLESVIVNALEVINGYTTISVTKKNSQIQKIQANTEDELQPVSTNVIGFEVPTNTIEEMEEEEE